METQTVKLHKNGFDAIILSGVAAPSGKGYTVQSEENNQNFKILAGDKEPEKEEYSIKIYVEKQELSKLNDNPDRHIDIPLNIDRYKNLRIELSDSYKDLVKSKN